MFLSSTPKATLTATVGTPGSATVHRDTQICDLLEGALVRDAGASRVPFRAVLGGDLRPTGRPCDEAAAQLQKLGDGVSRVTFVAGVLRELSAGLNQGNVSCSCIMRERELARVSGPSKEFVPWGHVGAYERTCGAV
jgi:hypothetical protein